MKIDLCEDELTYVEHAVSIALITLLSALETYTVDVNSIPIYTYTYKCLEDALSARK